ncbi:MAG: hypothetical protein J0L80_14865 [Chitinophagales bacterium]|nr:hypothetical protein [Chitinophagales bacterium]
MKKLFYSLMVTAISLASCTKQNNAVPTGTTNTTITDADFADNKAQVVSGQLKTTEPGVTLDYDFVIKEVSADKYMSAIRLNGIRLNGTKLNGVKFNGSQSVYKAIVIGINTTKEDPATPAIASKVETNFAILLDGAKAEKVGDIIIFEPFTYKEDLVNEVVDVTVKLTIGGGSVVIKDNSTVVLGGSTISLKENSNIIITGGNMVMTDESSFFVTKSGMTVEQNPRISIVRLRKSTLQGQTYGRVIVIVDNDPNNEVASLTYEPAPIALDPNKPDVLTKLPIMEFKETHYNKQQGMHRYESTQTWDAVYAKYGLKPIMGKEGFRIHQLRNK